jgi:hypothetical protein
MYDHVSMADPYLFETFNDKSVIEILKAHPQIPCCSTMGGRAKKL